MEKENGVSTSVVASVLLAFVITFFRGVQGTIGVNYGTVANDIPPVEEVAHFLLQKTVINRVRLFDANPSTLRAFTHTGIEVTITVPNEQNATLPSSPLLKQWINPPSTGKFRKGYDTVMLKPLLSFLRATSSPFMINPYPFFGYSADTLDYALFKPNTALKLLGFLDLAIVITEIDCILIPCYG
ncbi:hypothetical protein IFM89_016703 [Coptis chinensis]|uniref:Glucan endo-1,3-beta-D-glucosidase n=1 Tax=Coptis chinensis TaxID=261450 RepID=A0A835IPY1_9MAGN|nr:hypothetical protein IFM89_016703 [Coptis chinensis]